MKSDQLLYHYCAAPTAFAILQSRVFRLSALSSANDTLEGRLLGRVLSELLASAGLPKGVADVASVIAEGYPASTEGFALCLSEEGDQLSQWRAYARDGTGVAIGFVSSALEKDFGAVNFGSQFYELVKVEYGEEGLRKSLAPYVDELRAKFLLHGEFVRLAEGITKEFALTCLADREASIEGLFQGQQDSPQLVSEMMTLLAPLHFRIYATKPRTFYEEREWRLLRYRHRVALSDIEFFADDTSVRPFISCLLAEPAKEAIKELILGPKHRSDINWMRAFLDRSGMPHVKVRRSEATSYR